MNAFEIKNAVYNVISSALKNVYSDIFVTGEYTQAVSKLPAVTFIESENAAYEKAATDVKQNAVKLMYEVNVYTNTVGKKELEAREISETVDSAMNGIGFIRTYCSPVPNFADTSIYRIILRYEGVAVPEVNGTDTTYRIYIK